MKSDKYHDILNGFDFNLLDSSEFKEDSVREEIILPIIKQLGYSPNKPNQIIRSRSLSHPFVSIGSKKKNIYIVPDYLFEVDDNPVWILDAKSPSEEITKSSHTEQAYSYAIHPEVRVDFYGLCNGKEFVLYDIKELEPIFHFDIREINLYWNDLYEFLSPDKIKNSPKKTIKKDLGLHLKRLGFDKYENLLFPNVPIRFLGQMIPDFYTTACSVVIDGTTYVTSFDISDEAFKQLKGKIPDSAFEILSARETERTKQVNFASEAFLINVNCSLSEELQENENEIFLPLWVHEIISDEDIANIN